MFSFRLSLTKSTENVHETASVVVVGLENVVKAARQQVLDNAEAVDPGQSLVSLPSFSLKPQAQVSSRAITDDYEQFLSPEDRVKRRNELQKQKEQKHKKNQEQVFTTSPQNFSWNP